MRILLDTHLYLWWLQDHPKLSRQARSLVVAADEVFISSASIWEAAIKINIGKLEADIEELVAKIASNSFRELPVSASHAARILQLPDIHRDPFDRILIAQAMCEPLRFLTMDATLAKYSDLVEVL